MVQNYLSRSDQLSLRAVDKQCCLIVAQEKVVENRFFALDSTGLRNLVDLPLAALQSTKILQVDLGFALCDHLDHMFDKNSICKLISVLNQMTNLHTVELKSEPDMLLGNYCESCHHYNFGVRDVWTFIHCLAESQRRPSTLEITGVRLYQLFYPADCRFFQESGKQYSKRRERLSVDLATLGRSLRNIHMKLYMAVNIFDYNFVNKEFQVGWLPELLSASCLGLEHLEIVVMGHGEGGLQGGPLWSSNQCEWHYLTTDTISDDRKRMPIWERLNLDDVKFSALKTLSVKNMSPSIADVSDFLNRHKHLESFHIRSWSCKPWEAQSLVRRLNGILLSTRIKCFNKLRLTQEPSTHAKPCSRPDRETETYLDINFQTHPVPEGVKLTPEMMIKCHISTFDISVPKDGDSDDLLYWPDHYWEEYRAHAKEFEKLAPWYRVAETDWKMCKPVKHA